MSATNKHITNQEALLRAVDCLLGVVNADKHWGDNFNDEWNPIITTLTCELLLSCGLAPDTPWCVKNLKNAHHKLEDSFHWLDSKIGADGTFGTDFWDAARLAIFIERDKLHAFFPSYERLKAHLLNCIHKNTLLAGNSHWRGPAFLAAAADYLDLLGHAGEADGIIKRIIDSQQPDGLWQGNFGADGHPLVSPVWQTAQVIWTLCRRGQSEHRTNINKAIAWLKSVQSEEGCWAGPQQYIIYFTSYALTALLCAEKPEKESVSKAVDFLKSKMTPDGKCSDMGGTYLCAFALQQVVGKKFEHELTVTDYVLSRNNAIRAEVAETDHAAKVAELTETRQKLQKVEDDYRRLAEKYAGGEIVISKRGAFIITLIAPLFFVLATAVVQFGITKLGESNSQTQQTTKTNLLTITNVVTLPVQSITNKAP